MPYDVNNPRQRAAAKAIEKSFKEKKKKDDEPESRDSTNPEVWSAMKKQIDARRKKLQRGW